MQVKHKHCSRAGKKGSDLEEKEETFDFEARLQITHAECRSVESLPTILIFTAHPF